VCANYKGGVPERQALALGQQAIEAEALTLWKMNDVEIVLMLFQPNIRMI
jgi:hypothetical protein